MNKNIGILLNCDPESFDLKTAYDVIKRKGKYAWGTGGIQFVKKVVGELPNGEILGLLKISGKDKISYGVKVDVSEEFREYLQTQNTKKKVRLKAEHKIYRPDELKNFEDKSILLLSDLFRLNRPIQSSKIKVWNGKTFSSGFRSAVFIKLKGNGLKDPNKLYKESDEFDLFSNNPFVQILEYKEDDLTKSLVFLLKNYYEFAKDFLNLCKINKKSTNYKIIWNKQFGQKGRPDILFAWRDYELLVEAKLDSAVNKEQLKRYSSKGEFKVICITREEKKKEIEGVKFISWEEIYGIVEKFLNNGRGQKMLLVEYFRDYLRFLEISSI